MNSPGADTKTLGYPGNPHPIVVHLPHVIVTVVKDKVVLASEVFTYAVRQRAIKAARGTVGTATALVLGAEARRGKASMHNSLTS